MTGSQGEQGAGARTQRLVEDLTELQNTSIAKSLNDAQVLLWYTSREGIDIEDAVVEKIIQARNNYHAGNWDQEKELEFWHAFRELSAKAQPISVDSVRSIMPTGGSRSTEARRIGRTYTWSTMCVLFLIVLFQSYWFVGNNILNEVENIRELIAVANEEKIDAEARFFLLENLRYRKYPEVEKLELAGSLSPEQKTKYDELRAELSKIEQDTQALYSQLQGFDSKLAQLGRALASNFVLLSRWDLTARNVDINELVAGKDAFYYVGRGGQESDPSGLIYDTPFGEGREPTAEERAKRLTEETNRAQRAYLFEVSLKTSQSILQTLNSYILPLFYGLLGALAYILRTLTREIRTFTFSKASAIRYMLRWPLGMLAGITVGFFFKPEDLTGLAAITPIAVAFIAGYSVELVFTALDRIVSAFSETPERPAGRSQ